MKSPVQLAIPQVDFPDLLFNPLGRNSKLIAYYFCQSTGNQHKLFDLLLQLAVLPFYLTGVT